MLGRNWILIGLFSFSYVCEKSEPSQADIDVGVACGPRALRI